MTGAVAKVLTRRAILVKFGCYVLGEMRSVLHVIDGKYEARSTITSQLLNETRTHDTDIYLQ